MFCVFFNDTATTEIYTLSLHDALPIWPILSPDRRCCRHKAFPARSFRLSPDIPAESLRSGRSEEHTSELQSRQYLVCRLLLEKKISNRSREYVHSRPASARPRREAYCA